MAEVAAPQRGIEKVTPTVEAVRLALEDDLTIGISSEQFYDGTAGGYA